MKIFRGLFQRKPKIQKIELTKRFDFIGRVGQGSMSKVWRARDTLTGRTVALKVLDVEKTHRLESRFPGLNKPTEGEVAVQLKHPYIVNTLEHGISTQREQFIVMEFIEGVGLSYLVDVQNEEMQKSRLRFIVEFGSAIDYFHKQNWIHRDICPRNVIINTEGHVKLFDFGLVVPNVADFQRPGNRTGTVSYMAPELIKRQKTDQRIDVFSFAVSCFEMFTKRHPWDSRGESLDMAIQHINRPPRDIREFLPDIDTQIADAIMRGVAVIPQERWNSVAEMVREISDARSRLEPDSKPVSA